MPHQRLMWDVGLEIDPVTGFPAYREVMVTVMRQSGKTVALFAVEVERCTWDAPQRVVYTAQTGTDARAKLLRDQVPMLLGSPAKALLARTGPDRNGVHRGAAETRVEFASGSVVELMASGAAAGHGRTIELGVIDEAFKDSDDRREQALVPSMATVASAQLWVVSTAGTDESTYLRRKVEAGRAAAAADKGHGIAYFEWSVPPDEDPDDEEVWWRHMPALGWTIQPAAVRHARQSMTDAEFRRAYLNQWTATEHDHPIPLEVWRAVQDREAAPSGKVVYAVDVLPDRSAAAVAGAGGGQVALLDHRPGTGWVVPLMLEVVGRSATVLVDGGGPAAPLADDLEAVGFTVRRLGSGEVAAGCGRFYDSVADRKIRIRPSKDLDVAVDGLSKRPVGDRFVWSRSTSATDVTPLMAATLALAGTTPHAKPKIHTLEVS